jgi:enoyl-CoA hydratase/carnithine racemase
MLQPTDELQVRRLDRAVLQLTLARPARANALSESLVEALLAALAEAEREQMRLVIFRGEGKNFCSGFDLSDLAEQKDADLVRKLIRIEELLQRVAYAPFLTLALAHGRVMGAGADLFCACSERVAAPDTTFRMPGWRFGIALGTRRLAARIGTDAARRVLLESKQFDAGEALEMRFATMIASEPGWPDVIERVSRQAHALDWESMRHLLSLTLSDTRAEDMAALVETSARPGLKERIQQYRNSEKAR